MVQCVFKTLLMGTQYPVLWISCLITNKRCFLWNWALQIFFKKKRPNISVCYWFHTFNPSKLQFLFLCPLTSKADRSCLGVIVWVVCQFKTGSEGFHLLKSRYRFVVHKIQTLSICWANNVRIFKVRGDIHGFFFCTSSLLHHCDQSETISII